MYKMFINLRNKKRFYKVVRTEKEAKDYVVGQLIKE